MASLAEVRAAHPVKDRDAYDKAYKEADLAGRIAAMAYGMRVAAGLSQSELAKRMGTSQPAIARLENAGTVPGIEFLARLASSTGVELSLSAVGIADVNVSSAIVAETVAAGRTSSNAPKRAVPTPKAPAKKSVKKAPARGTRRAKADA